MYPIAGIPKADRHLGRASSAFTNGPALRPFPSQAPVDRARVRVQGSWAIGLLMRRSSLIAAPENSTPQIPLPSSPGIWATLGAHRTVPIQRQKSPPLCGASVWQLQVLLGGERCQPELKMLSMKAWTSGALCSNANLPQLPGMPKSDNLQVALKYSVVKTAKNSSTFNIA